MEGIELTAGAALTPRSPMDGPYGAAVDIGWIFLGADTGLYELLPGFICGLIVAVIVTLATKAPGADVKALFAKAVAYTDEAEEAEAGEEALVEAE